MTQKENLRNFDLNQNKNQTHVQSQADSELLPISKMTSILASIATKSPILDLAKVLNFAPVNSFHFLKQTKFGKLCTKIAHSHFARSTGLYKQKQI